MSSPTPQEKADDLIVDGENIAPAFISRMPARQKRAFRDAIASAIAEAERAADEARNAAYRERNQVVAALARLFPSGIARTDIPGWDAEWHGCVYIDLPTGQVSWHYHDREADLFADLPPYTKSWDGHDTPEKYRRLAAIRARAEDPAHD